MLASRLQQALIKRVEFIENLALLHSVSELLTLSAHQYQAENEQMYEKEMIMVETFRNIFRIDESFRRFYYKVCLTVFLRLHPRHKKSPCKNITRIHNVYFEFLLFFKGINELAIANHLCDLNFQALSENDLFLKLTHTLIKYLKIKTEVAIQKLMEKCTTKSRPRLERGESNIQKQHVYEDLERREHAERKRFNNFLRKSSNTQAISKRKYNSEQNPKKWTQPNRKISNEMPLSSLWPNESRDNDKGKGIANIDWKIRIKKFQEYYCEQWSEFYRITGLESQMEQLKVKVKKADCAAKKEWMSENYRSLFQEMLNRNQQASQSLTFFKEACHRTP